MAGARAEEQDQEQEQEKEQARPNDEEVWLLPWVRYGYSVQQRGTQATRRPQVTVVDCRLGEDWLELVWIRPGEWPVRCRTTTRAP